MKKNFTYYIAAIAGVMMMLTSCFREDLLSKDGVKSDVITLDIKISVPDMSQVATKAVDPDGGGVQNITLFCFDQYGLFVSTLSADVKPASSGVSLTGSFKVEVPSHVKTVHLVGNQNLSYFAEGNYTGKSEIEVMSSLQASAGRMIYWARKSVSELQPGTTVQLLRNQASFSVSVEQGVNFVENGWVVMNTSAFGTVAPYDNASGQFVAPSVDNPFVTVPEDETRLNSFYDVRLIDTEYYFETENTHENPVDVIIRGTQASGEELYYRVSLLDSEGEPVNVMRNHHYKIIIAGELSYGKKTFNEALSASATNNIWVSVSDEVRRVFDSEKSLEVAQTYVVVGEEEFDTPNTYDLFYTVSKSDSDLTMADQPEVTWLDGNNVAQHNFVHDFDPATGEGMLTVSLLPLGDLQKREGTLVVKFGRLYRNIKVVTVKKQSFTPAWITTNIYGEQAYENVTLMFTIPETCPEELFPMDVLLSADEFDIRTASGMSLPTITAGQPGFGEPNKSGYKYVLTVAGTGMQRVYLETSLTHAVSETVQVTVEAPHFESLVKTATFQNQTNTRILIHNLRKYVATTPADEYIYYYQVPQKIYAQVEFSTHLGEVTDVAPVNESAGVTLTNPDGVATHYRFIAPNMNFTGNGSEGPDVDEFLLYSQNLEHNHDGGPVFYFDVYRDLDPANWDANGGRVLGIIRNTNATAGEGAVYHFRTTRPKADEVVRIASNVKGAPSVTTGTAGELVVMKDYKPGTCTGTGRHKSCVFELATFHPFQFAATVNGTGTLVSNGAQEVEDQLTFTYEPGAAVDIEFDVTSFTAQIRDERGNLLPESEFVSVDPFGTEFSIFIDAPMLEIDAARNTLPSDKFYYDQAEGKFVYVVDADRETERSFWTEEAYVKDTRNVDYLGNVLAADKQMGERKSLPFKTKEIVSAGKIVISSDQDKVVFNTKTFNVTNELITGRIQYGEAGSEKDVPAGSFVPFEVLPTYSRIGSMTIGQNGQYQLHLRGEYIYNWNTDDIKFQYVEKIGDNETIYEASFSSLAELYGSKDILLTPKK